MSTWKHNPNPYFSPTQYQREHQSEAGPSIQRRYPSQNYMNHDVPASNSLYGNNNEDNGRFEDAESGDTLVRQMRQASLGGNADEESRRRSVALGKAFDHSDPPIRQDWGKHNESSLENGINNYSPQPRNDFHTPYHTQPSNAVASTSYRFESSYRKEDPKNDYSSPSTNSSDPSQLNLYPDIPSDYHRDRLTSATSIQSMSASNKGRRAPAPAALDLSSRTERTKRDNAGAGNGPYGRLGNGMPAGFDEHGRRILSEPMTGSRRPLPQTPQVPAESSRSPPLQYTSYTISQSPSFPSSQPLHQHLIGSNRLDHPTTFAHITQSPSMPLTVPLSAVGRMYGSKDGAVDDIRNEERTFNLDPMLDHTQQTPLVPSNPFTPLTPGWPDPESIDRRGLIGVGELATPRWATSSNHAHLRTPSVPQYFSSVEQQPSMPNAATSRFWGKAESGYGLGMGMMNDLREEDHRQSRSLDPRFERHIPHSPPRPARNPQRSSLSSASSPKRDSRNGEMPDLADYGDFEIDPSMEAAVASISFDSGLSDQTVQPPPERNIISAPPPPRRGSLPQTEGQQPGLPVSPESARARIYARRQEREKRASLSAQSQMLAQQSYQNRPPSPLQAPPNYPPNFKYTPPNSATSSEFQSSLAPSSARSRDSRKTPPHTRETSSGRAGRSPSTSHDILKIFAPKDFSHLPPSPSSASINQFLKNSSSVNSFAAIGSPATKTPPAVVAGSGYFPTQPPPLPQSTPGRSSLQRSDSQKSQKLKNLASGRPGHWEGREIDSETAEAMRKLDGLGGTPSKNKTPSGKYRTSTGSRPATPPTVKKDDKGRYGVNLMPSGGEEESPISNWVELAADDGARGRDKSHGLDRPFITEKRESSSSTSFVGTPTSRDSHTSATTPPSISATGGKLRRASVGSEVSVRSDTALQDANGSHERVGNLLPPVPPLPKGYISMRQGLAQAAQTPSYTPMQDSPPIETAQPANIITTESVASTPPSNPSSASLTDTARPRVNKKWSFSSAISLKMGNKDGKDTGSSAQDSPTIDEYNSDNAWSEVNHGDTISPPPPLNRLGSDSSSFTANRSQISITPVGPAVPPSSTKPTSGRSMSFFRRTSTTAQPATSTIPETPKSAQLPPSKIPTSSARKSMLGMHLPNMLRGSGSKRHLSQQLEADNRPEVGEMGAEMPEKAATTGWKGRSRGKTLSISGPIQPTKGSLPPNNYQSTQQGRYDPIPLADEDEPTLNHKSSFTSGVSESTVNSQTLRPNKSGLPPVAGLRGVASNGSLRNSDSSSQISKIPRLTKGASPAPGSMGPPNLPTSASSSKLPAHAKSMSSVAALGGSTGGISEFGTVNAPSARYVNDIQRSRLLAPMSMRPEAKQRQFAKPIVRERQEWTSNVPPSRRNMPLKSTLTAPTIASQSKRTSTDVRPPPAMSRTSSKDGSSSENSTVIKPSKSLHGNLSIAPGTKLPASSSMGAPGLSHRKASLVASASASPAEDEETLADNDMVAYVERRKARVANGNKKDDLADIEEFPDDIDPAEPKSQRSFLSHNLSTMSDYERKEILDFDSIYFSPVKPIVRPLQNGASYNHGYDDERGDYLVMEGDHMCYRYEVVKILGKGSFGQVVQCRDHKTGSSVAVKIIRNKKRFHAQALIETKILGQIVEWDPEDKHRMVKMTDNFYFRQHLCIVTELLSINLYELIKANHFEGFSTTLIRRFTTQMLSSLQLMRSHRIVHCDLKPENILLCHPIRSGIKVIDFGSSCHETEKVYTYIQSRFYRSPEVILGMNYAMAIDMWSLGCILAELYTGMPIFPGENEQEQLACIMEVLGPPDREIVNKAQRRKLFFDATGAPRPFVTSKGKRRRPASRTLAQVLRCKDELFVDFVSKCLTWDPDRRLKPQPAMRHPWILQGRRRYAPPPPTANMIRRESSQSGSEQAQRNSGMSKLASEKSPLVISSPGPLVARYSGLGNSGGHRSGGSSGPKLAPPLSTRNSGTSGSVKNGYN